MPVLRAANVPAAVSRFSMADVESEAREMIRAAQERADRIISEARQHAEDLKAEAKAAGLAEGRAEGLVRGRDEGLRAGREEALAGQRAALSAAVEAINAGARQVNEARLELQAAALTDVVKLAIAIAERITRRLGAIDPSVLLANTEESLKLVSHASDVRIAIHPAQRATLESALPRLKLTLPKLEHVDVVDDPAIAPGGCRVFTARAEIDADLDEQLRRIVAELLPESARENPA